MSLINKMLQDLDARGSPSGAALQAEIKPVLAAERSLPVRQIALAACVLVVALAVSAWFWLKKPGADVPAIKPLAMGAPPATATVTAPIVPLPPSKSMNEKAVEAVEAEQAKPPVTQAEAPAQPDAVATVKPPRARTRAPKVTAPTVVAVAPPVPVGGREMTAAQRSESMYREAMAHLDNGRVAAAMEGLERTLKLNPRHDGARQSLASLLIEAGRVDEAMQQLEQGLAADPAQPGMAMLLARMQIERGASGLPVLQRSLVAGTGSADYHAFYAGALQRAQRHREAIEQYAAALRSNPDNGVWLMGVGISLHAEKRNAEALTAFEQAKASRTLSAPLLEFVERKLQQLRP